MAPEAELATGRPPVTADSTIRVHPLSMRQDRDSWIIGRADTGDFIQVPDVAHRILLLLDDRRTVQQVTDALGGDGGEPVDVAGFVEDLADLGFIDAIGAHPLPQPDPPPPSLAWLKPGHTGWLLHPVTALAASAVVAAGIGCLAAHPALAPTYRSLVWSRWAGLVLAGNLAIAWSLIFLHELSHLATARAAGVPARLSLGTRLQFLAAQTDVTGVWAARRRVRLTVFLAGIVMNLVVASLGLIILTAAGPSIPAEASRIAEATILLSVLGLPIELFVFMRTDVYFVLQDLTGCLSLYSDGTGYVRYLIRRAGHRAGLRVGQPADPSLDLDARERRAVRLYSLVLTFGTAACLAIAVTTELPATFLLFDRAFRDLAVSPSAAGLANGGATCLAAGGMLALWGRAWWRRHGQRLRGLLRAPRRQPEGGDAP
jgi:putative peptide zinc metalloprotease protein